MSGMRHLSDIIRFLEDLAPLSLAEEWDNVGLLLGDRRRPVTRVMTCLTLTPPTVAEAVEHEADLVVVHHPLPFRPVQRITADTTVGAMLLELISSDTAVYSAHTAFDSAAEGINQRLAQGLQLRGIAPLVPGEGVLGTGRTGWLEQPTALAALADRAKQFLGIDRMGVVGDLKREVRLLGVTCGAADDLLRPAIDAGCECVLVGEARFHTCLEAEAAGVSLLLPGHFASERFAMEALADVLRGQFPEMKVWPAHRERDPLHWA
ncbi:MAG: Nif3-like dinuclear metal center hexameric protein [Patescibacteria group bacterium]|nr:Nif3-like dinuclear metal center hexameric protein [Patescibacteria group bacterium]